MNIQRYFKSADVVDPERGWRFRVTLASLACDPMGPIVRAVLGVNSGTGTLLGLAATIRKDGIVVAPLRNSQGAVVNSSHPLGSITALRDEFRRLADHCKLDDADRTALFDELRKWCGKDLRPRDDGYSFEGVKQPTRSYQ